MPSHLKTIHIINMTPFQRRWLNSFSNLSGILLVFPVYAVCLSHGTACTPCWIRCSRWGILRSCPTLPAVMTSCRLPLGIRQFCSGFFFWLNLEICFVNFPGNGSARQTTRTTLFNHHHNYQFRIVDRRKTGKQRKIIFPLILRGSRLTGNWVLIRGKPVKYDRAVPTLITFSSPSRTKARCSCSIGIILFNLGRYCRIIFPSGFVTASTTCGVYNLPPLAMAEYILASCKGVTVI